MATTIPISASTPMTAPSSRRKGCGSLERDVKLPGSPVRWRFQVAQSRDGLDAQIDALRQTLVRSFVLLALGLIVMAALQTFYGLWPLRKVREEIARMRAGKSRQIERAMPIEVAPMVEELNALLAHNERQAEEARRHAGNLAHALKTPADRDHERRDRPGRRSWRHGDPRGADDAAPGRSPSRPRARGRPARLGAQSRRGLAQPRIGRARGGAALSAMSASTSTGRRRSRSMSSARTSTRCSAI